MILPDTEDASIDLACSNETPCSAKPHPSKVEVELVPCGRTDIPSRYSGLSGAIRFDR